MKKLILLLLVALVSYTSFAQTEEALVFFADKENVEAALANPITILTQEAIDRKYMHNISIDERDVPLNETYKATISNQTGITVFSKSKWLNAVYVRGSKANIENLLHLEFVTDIEFMNKDFNRPFKPRIPRDKFEIENQPTPENFNYGAASNQTEMINVDILHDQGYTGAGIVIAFMDNGYPNVLSNRAYVNMRNENRLLGYYDFVDRVVNENGTGNHGANTLSTSGAVIDGQFVGTGPNASYYLFITEDGRQESPVEEAYWVEALERADSLGVFVTNTSLGYQEFDNRSYDYEYSDLDGQTTLGSRGANIAFDKGMINVVSAGNSAQGFGYVNSPADAPGSFTVGAVDSEEEYVYFSSFGPTYDGRVKPDVMAQGRGTAIVNRNGNVDSSNGTSFSAPIIAGAIASLWEVAPHLTNQEITQIVRESAHLYDSPSDLMGYGIPNFELAFHMALELDVENHKRDMLFAVYPNPVNTQLNVSFPQNASTADFILYDILGKKVLQQTISASQNQVDLSHLKSGLYIAAITSDSKTTSFKIIKQ